MFRVRWTGLCCCLRGVFLGGFDFPVIIMQSHRIEEINEYVGGEEVADGYLPFCENTAREARDKAQGVCMGEGQVSVFVKHTL